MESRKYESFLIMGDFEFDWIEIRGNIEFWFCE
jgi:hypothetical protein